MLVGYFVKIQPELASFRFRVAIPSQHLDNFVVGDVGDVSVVVAPALEAWRPHDPRATGPIRKIRPPPARNPGPHNTSRKPHPAFSSQPRTTPPSGSRCSWLGAW